MGKWTFKSLADAFFDIEHRFNLLEEKIFDVYFWKLIRFNLFSEITIKTKLHKTGHPGAYKNASVLKKIVLELNSAKRKLQKYIGHSPFSGNMTADIILFPHSRKVLVEGIQTDIYSAAYEKKWQEEKKSYIVVDREYQGKFLYPKRENVFYDSIQVLFIKRKLKKEGALEGCPTPAQKDFLENIRKEFARVDSELDNLGNLRNTVIIKEINRFKVEYDHYTRLLRKRSPKEIYLLVSYISRNHALIKAARDLGIRTVEIQHGTITMQHTGYSFPNAEKVPYFPDELHIWGQYWADITPLPLKKENLRVTGFPYFAKKIKHHTRISEKEVLFISQATIAPHLINLAISLAHKAPQYRIKYRFHPSEYPHRGTLYPHLTDAMNTTNNFVIADNASEDIYASFSQAAFVVGVYSTALIEAVALGCRMILINLPGVEYYKYLTDNNIVPLSECKTESLIDAISGYSQYPYDPNYFINTSICERNEGNSAC